MARLYPAPGAGLKEEGKAPKTNPMPASSSGIMNLHLDLDGMDTAGRA